MSALPPASDRSTRPLSEVARHLVIPEGIVRSVWFDLDHRFEEWGVRFDRWQDGAGQILLGTRADEKYAATVGGATWSIPRQVAKTFLISRTIFALSSHLEDQTWLWTAHRTRTATQTFQKLAGFADSRRVKPFIEGIRTANGEQEIRFRNGSRILFGAREQGFGRGFDEVDGEVFDEGQILTERALEDMVPAANQSRNPHGALLIFMGTPPRPVDPGEVLKARRREALALKPDDEVMVTAGDSFYLECSADPATGKKDGPGLDDLEQIAKANPSFPHRTPPESVARMRKNLPSDEAWRREALGIWDADSAGSRLISEVTWHQAAIEPPQDGVRSFGVAFSIDGSKMSVGGCLKHADGFHVELVDHFEGDVEDGIASLADWLAERKNDVAQIVMSGNAGAPVLAQALRDRGVPKQALVVASTLQYRTACATFHDGIKDGSVTHSAIDGQARLDDSIAISDQKVARGGGWGWQSSTADGDETPVEAVSLAVYGAKTSKRVPGRKARVMV